MLSVQNQYCTPTIPNQNPTEEYESLTFPPHLSAFGVWESFRAVSKARRDFFTWISLFFRNPSASLCGQTFDTAFPLSLFFSAERSGRQKIIQVLYISVWISFRIFREFVRKPVRSRFWFFLPLSGIMKAKNFRRFCLCRQSSLQELPSRTSL